MRRLSWLLIVVVGAAVLGWPIARTQAQAPIEDRLNIITPVARSVADPAVEAFANTHSGSSASTSA
jgi:hypothetical protein